MDIIVDSNGEKIKSHFKAIKNKSNICLLKGKYHFESSHIYTLLSDNYENLALSYLLTGRVQLHNTNIKINGISISKKELEQISCYVGSSSSKKRFFNKPTVRDEINNALTFSNISMNIEDIVNYFSLTPSRLDRLLKYTGNEHWRASLAIGYSNEKKIYCFPYVTEELSLELVRLRIDEFIIRLKNEGNIIIIPSDKKTELIKVSDELCYVK